MTSMTDSIRIGNQTAISARPPLAPFRYALRQRFEAFEWFDDARDGRGFRFVDCDAGRRRRIRRIGRDRGLYYTVHASLRANVLDAADPALAEAVAFATAIDAHLIVTHFPRDAEADTTAAALHDWSERTAEHNICVTLENTVDTGPERINGVFSLLPAGSCAREFAGLCFDMGHANLHREWRNDYIGYFDQIRDHVPVRHVHLHENHGDRDAHLPLFTGPSAHDPTGPRLLLQRLHRRRYHGALIMEQWPEPPAALRHAYTRLRSMVDTTSAPAPLQQ